MEKEEREKKIHTEPEQCRLCDAGRYLCKINGTQWLLLFHHGKRVFFFCLCTLQSKTYGLWFAVCWCRLFGISIPVCVPVCMAVYYPPGMYIQSNTICHAFWSAGLFYILNIIFAQLALYSGSTTLFYKVQTTGQKERKNEKIVDRRRKHTCTHTHTQST